MKTHILFDFDGTLVDSAPAILCCFEKVLKLHQLPARRAIDSSLIGPPLKETLAILSGKNDSELLDTLAESFKELYDTEICVQTKSYEGFTEVLRELYRQGYTLAIATNKRLLPTQRIITALGWSSFFSKVFASDSHLDRYSDKSGMIAALIKDLSIKPNNAVYVGDTVADSYAAQLNELEFWPVSWGYGRFEEYMHPLKSPQHLMQRIEQS